MTERRSILAAATNAKNLQLLKQVLEKEGYPVIAVDSLEGIDAALLENKDIALALLDLSGFDRRVWERCERIRETGIPFLLISARQSSAIQKESISRGAHGILVKPLVIKELLGLVRSFMDEQQDER
jgi:DNA-binding response OmpR family regulator